MHVIVVVDISITYDDLLHKLMLKCSNYQYLKAVIPILVDFALMVFVIPFPLVNYKKKYDFQTA